MKSACNTIHQRQIHKTTLWYVSLVICALAQNGFSLTTDNRPPAILCYKNPATKWAECNFPLGNGRIGASVFGGVPRERIALNHNRVWRETQRTLTIPDTADNLPRVRKLFFEGKTKEAGEAAFELLGCEKFGQPRKVWMAGNRYDLYRTDNYVPVGDLILEFPGTADYSDYRRELNLINGLACVTYRQGETTFKREIFVSADDPYMILRFTADKPGSLSFSASLSRTADKDCQITQFAKVSRFGFLGRYPEGVSFAAVGQIQAKGGQLHLDSSRPAALKVEQADEVMIFISMASHHEGNPMNVCIGQLDALSRNEEFEKRFEAHRLAFEKVMNRVGFTLGDSATHETPSDQRCHDYNQNPSSDLGVIPLAYQYSRYLLWSACRPGGMPYNLFGMWSEPIAPPNSGDFHWNINVQEDMWIVDPGHIPESFTPLMEYLERLMPSARLAAKRYYGCRGIFISHTTDGAARVIKTGTPWAEWIGAGGWISQMVWAHYDFTRDRDFLRNKAYPFMKEVGLFYHDYLVRDPRLNSPFRGKLVPVPSHSPENAFIGGSDVISLGIGATSDIATLRDVFKHLIEASVILGIDGELRKTWQYILDNLPPYQVSKRTECLQEWLDDFPEKEPGHRHLSHLLGFWPMDSINSEDTPELISVVRASLKRRIEHGSWFHNTQGHMFARLGDGGEADKHLRAWLSFYTGKATPIHGALIGEMLLQSHNGRIRLLPAIPKTWSKGQFSGIQARGGVTVSLSWENGRATQGSLHVSSAVILHIQAPPGQMISTVTNAGETVPFTINEDQSAVIRTQSGKSYELKFR